MDLVPFIFFEKQEGSLCAQHALNALLQGPYFTAVELAEIARKLDNQEAFIAHGQQMTRSDNYDDSGFFSIQVMQAALKVWELDIIPWNAIEAKDAREIPQNEKAFICNLQEHWYTLRRFGSFSSRWYNLNSILNQPEWISSTYLGMMLQSLQQEGYSIFVINGDLPQCDADVRAILLPEPNSRGTIDLQKDEDWQIRAAIDASLKHSEGVSSSLEDNNTQNFNDNQTAFSLYGDEEMRQAIEMSLQQAEEGREVEGREVEGREIEGREVEERGGDLNGDANVASQESLNIEELRRRRLEHFKS